jgi:hypothetical protein
MNPLLGMYADLYIACGCLASAAIIIRMSKRLTSGQRLLSSVLIFPLIVIYLLGMNRIAGVDYDNYFDAYMEQGQPIPDIGYTALTQFARFLGIPFDIFLLLQGVLTLFALWLAAKGKRADPFVTVVIYLLHLAIVRDLSQSRIGLAISIYLLGQTRDNRSAKYTLYACAASVHITVVALIIVQSYAAIASRLSGWRQVGLVYIPLGMFSLYGVFLLGALGVLDPRVEYYLGWDEVGYGSPLSSYGALWRTALVVATFALAMKKLNNISLKEFIILELAGAAILIGFAQFSIFSARLSNVAISMYPIGLGIVFQYFRLRPRGPGEVKRDLTIRFLVIGILFILLLRPGSTGALAEVMPRFFNWLGG